MQLIKSGILAAFVGGCLLAMAPASAIAMTVEPVVIDLTPVGRQMSATVSVQNTFTTPLPVELTVKPLVFDENGAKAEGDDPGDLLIFPPQAIVAPGQTQAFRIQWVGDTQLAKSRHYYVTVAQLPVKLPEGQSAIQILYDFQVLVNVAASDPHVQLSIQKAEIVNHPAQKSADGKTDRPAGFSPAVWVANSGNSYGYLSQHTVRLTVTDASGKETFKQSFSPEEIRQSIGFGVIGPDTARRIVFPIELPNQAGAVKVEISDAKRH